MHLSERQRETYERRATDGGFASPHLPPPHDATLRQLSMAGGRGHGATVGQSVGAGARSHWNAAGTPLASPVAQQVVADHFNFATATPRGTTYAAAHWDPQQRPQDVLALPNRSFGSHTRGETESHGHSAAPMDHRGHGVAQALTMFPPGVHHSFMTSQSPAMNTAVQLPFERGVNALISSGRQPVWEVHNEFAGATPAGQLPRASHQTFAVMSTDASGNDLRVHTHLRVSQR